MEPQTHEIFAVGLTSSSLRKIEGENVQVMKDEYYHNLLQRTPISSTGMHSRHMHDIFEVRGNIRQIHNCDLTQEHDGGWFRGGSIEPENALWSRPLDSDIPGPQARYRDFIVNENFCLGSAFTSCPSSSFKDNSPEKEYSNPDSGKFFENMNLEKRIHRREPLGRYENLAATTTSRVRAMFEFQPIGSRELNFRQRYIMEVLELVSKDLGKASLTMGTGTFPLHRVGKFSDSMREEHLPLQQQEAQIVKGVYADVQDVKKLLELLMISSQPTEYEDKIKDKNKIEVSTMSNCFIQFR
jgi:hypothetical protein